MTKKVMVIGAGPAGLECAVTAARRGHKVTVYEKEDHIGGQLVFAMKEPSGSNAFMDLVRHYEVMIEKHGIDVVTGTEMTARMAHKLEPDVAVVAAGARLGPAPFKVSGDALIHSAYDILSDEVSPGGKVIVFAGDRLGLVAAEYAASKGAEVTVVETGRSTGRDIAPTFKWRHAAWLKEYGITAFTGAKVVEVTGTAVLIADKDGNEHRLEAETLVLGGPRLPANELVTEMDYSVDELYVIGDAVSPRSLPNAIHEGYKIGVRI